MEEASSLAAEYAARTGVRWERTAVFLLSGRARVDGGDVLFEGRFALWGSASDGLLRGDLCGPDGRPVVSWLGDRSGLTIYLPGEEKAVFHPGGASLAGFRISCTDLLHLMRTGFPLLMESWQIAPGGGAAGSVVEWEFAGGRDTLRVRLHPGDEFPREIDWPAGSIRIDASSPQDIYDSWPSGWRFDAGGVTVVASVNSISTDAEPWDGLWSLSIAVPVDTAGPLPPLEPAWDILQR